MRYAESACKNFSTPGPLRTQLARIPSGPYLGTIPKGATTATSEITFSAEFARTTPRSEPVANERARRGPQEEHAGDVVHRVHRFALLAQIHTCARLPAILVDLKQYVAVSIGRASQHEN